MESNEKRRWIMLFGLSVLFGAVVGFALGLTGGGGSLFAVPLLMYGLSMAPRDAIGVSLAAVGATAMVGVISRFRRGEVELSVGLWFAVAGMVGAPFGTWVAGRISETVLLGLFAALMLFVAARMWRKAEPNELLEPIHDDAQVRGACRRSNDGELALTSRCAAVLALVGLTTGFLSGMFGVGGGFVIVPALVFFAGTPIRKAIATSLFVIVLVSISGVASHVAAGRDVSMVVTGLFVLGGVVGMALGGRLAERLPTAVLQRVFATGIACAAVVLVGKSIY